MIVTIKLALLIGVTLMTANALKIIVQGGRNRRPPPSEEE